MIATKISDAERDEPEAVEEPEERCLIVEAGSDPEEEESREQAELDPGGGLDPGDRAVPGQASEDGWGWDSAATAGK